PLVRVVGMATGEGGGSRLLLVVHHLVVDGVSWRVLLEDLQRGYEQAQRGAAVELGRKTTSFQEWSQRLQAYAQSDEVRQEAGYWEAVAQRARASRRLASRRLGLGGAAIGAGGSEAVVVGRLSGEQTRLLLTEVGVAYRSQIDE